MGGCISSLHVGLRLAVECAADVGGAGLGCANYCGRQCLACGGAVLLGSWIGAVARVGARGRGCGGFRGDSRGLVVGCAVVEDELGGFRCAE